MSDDFAKFLFLGAMILIVLVSNRGAIYKEADSFSNSRLAATVVGSAQEPPLFVLEPPAAGRKEGLGVAASEEIRPIVVTPPVRPIRQAQGGQGSPLAVSGVEPQAALFENAPIIAGKPSDAQAIRPGSRQGGDMPAPSITAASAMVADMLDGRTPFELYAERRWPIASITKLVSAAVVSKNFPMHEVITMIAEDLPAQLPENGLQEAERYSIQDLMAAMLLESSNQAAEALARFWGSGRFVQAMNSLAKEWGLDETHFDDPTGLSASNQSTAKDLFRLAKNIYERHPEIFQITRQESAAITELNLGRKVIIKNINLFAGKDYFLGGKTGYTDEAGGNLLSVFNYENRPIFIVVLGSDDRFGETERLFEWFKRNNE